MDGSDGPVPGLERRVRLGPDQGRLFRQRMGGGSMGEYDSQRVLVSPDEKR